ncbi:tryptophan 2,3-dioxygenase [Streptomyces albus]|nr:tryptophan 2,3-dioxygenase [Streptomyces albus]
MSHETPHLDTEGAQPGSPANGGPGGGSPGGEGLAGKTRDARDSRAEHSGAPHPGAGQPADKAPGTESAHAPSPEAAHGHGPEAAHAQGPEAVHTHSPATGHDGPEAAHTHGETPEAAHGDAPEAADPDNPEAPNFDFADTTPYEDYAQADVLTHLQHPLSEDPGEMVFLVTTQVMELWFTVLVHEWETASRALRREDLPVAIAALKRSVRELEALNASWTPLAQLTPAQFNSYRSALGEGSGFQSAMYRRMEFLLGEKSASMLVPHRGSPRVHAELEKALAEPSLYDEVLRFLHRAGHPVPDAVLERDLRLKYQSSPEVEEIWARIYSGEESAPEQRLGEALTDVAELVWRWRNDHLVATRRAMGSKVGTGGSAGVAWLEKRATKNVFPELWSARSRV